MSNLFGQGLTISIVGMSLTFLALGLLILAMILLERIFRAEKPTAEPEPAEESTVGSLAQDSADEEVVAAIATALAYLRSRQIYESSLGSSLETGPARWWYVGRTQQSPADALKINQWRNK